MRQRGVTLAEMLATVAVIALVAGLALPDSRPASSFAADAAAGEIVRAVRFAQREAVRTGAWHTAQFDVATQTLRVYRLSSAGVEDSSAVLHPVDKAKYELRLGDMAGTIGRLATVEIKFKTRPMGNTISFRPDGYPASINPADLSVDLLESDGKVVVAHGSVQRQVTIARVTGRVMF